MSQITYHSPVPSPQTAELLQLNFSRKDSLQDTIQHDFFKQKVNVSNFSKCNWATKLLQDWGLIAWTWSTQLLWHHLVWLLPYLPILRSASNAMDPHPAGLTCPAVSSFLTDVKTQSRHLLSKPGCCCFRICISACSFLPGQACNISLLFHIRSKVITKERHVSSAIWARNII